MRKKHICNQPESSPVYCVESVYYFCKDRGIIQRSRREESERQRGQNLPLDFCKNEGLFSLQWPYFVYETLLHYCSTQLKVLTNVFCLEYCTEVIYVYMYSFMNVFLIPYTRMECNFFVILFAISSLWRLSRDLACVGSGGPLLLLYCVLYVLWFVFKKNSSVFEASMNSVWRNAFLFIWIATMGLEQKGLLFPLLATINLSIYLSSWWNCYICTLN